MLNLQKSKAALAAFKQQHRQSGPATANNDSLFELVDILEKMVAEVEERVPDFKYVEELAKGDDPIKL